jgi:uncharacterized protein (TIGR03118 family)
MRQIVRASGLAGALLACAVAFRAHAQTGSYTQINIASDIVGMAESVAPQMINPWGLTHTNGTRQGSGWYIAYAGAGVLDEITAEGDVSPYFITIPAASGQGDGTPAGACVFGGITTFTTLDGTVQQPLSSDIATIVINNAVKGAAYTACAQWRSSGLGLDTLYVANSAGGVEAYDSGFNPVTLAPGAFTDPNIPSGFAPYGMYAGGSRVQGGHIWVSFFNGTPGPGQGYVDAFDQNGNLLLSLQQGSWMNQPYGITQAPASGFGPFNYAILVAMTGSGTIAVFNPSSGAFIGFLKNSSGQYLVNQGIHGLGFGSGSIYGGPTNTLYFTAGIDNFQHGLFGEITANKNN